MNLPPNEPRNETRQEKPPPPRPGLRVRWRARLGRFLAWLIDPGGESSLGQGLPRAFPLFLLLFGAGMILISLIGDQGLISYYQLRHEAASLREDVERLKARKDFLGLEIEALRNDPGYIEHLARKDLGLVKPGEIVLQLPRKAPAH